MRQIKISQRQARMLVENLTANKDGYDFLDLKKLDWLAGRLQDLQGEYGSRMAELAREERAIRRQLARAELQIEKNKKLPEQERAEANRPLLDQQMLCTKELAVMGMDIADLHEGAESVMVELLVEEADRKLIEHKLDSVEKWMGVNEFRALIIGLVEAVKNAPEVEKSSEKKLSLVGESSGSEHSS